MSSSIVVRPARAEDFHPVYTVLYESWNTAYAPLLGKERAARLQPGPWMLRRMLDGAKASPRHFFDVAELEGELVAFASSGPDFWFKRSFLWMLYVLPDFQGRGVGRHLLAAVADAERGARTMRLEVLRGNVAAQRFYEKQGFRVIAHSWNFSNWQRVKVMEKLLHPVREAQAESILYYLYGKSGNS